MPWDAVIRSFTLIVVLLNPFLLAVYLLPLIRELDAKTFAQVLLRGGFISTIAFIVFALLGDAVFRDLLQVRFAAFLVFGGLVFLLIGLRYMVRGPEAIELLHGQVDHIAGSVAMPFMIGPGTINASVLAGSQMPIQYSAATIVAAVAASLIGVWILKEIHDFVNRRNSKIVARYVDLIGRISALVIGAIAVEMIFLGLEQWIATMGAAPSNI